MKRAMSVMASTRTTNNRKQGYSPKEQQLLDVLMPLLSNGKLLSSTELIKKLYANGDAPYYAHQSVTALMSSLIRKVEHNAEPFIVTKSAAAGPYPISYGIAVRKRRKAHV